MSLICHPASEGIKQHNRGAWTSHLHANRKKSYHERRMDYIIDLLINRKMERAWTYV